MLLPYLSIVLLEVKNIKVKQLIRVADFKYFLLMVVFIVLADLGFNGSFAFGGNVAIAGTIAGSYVTLTTLLTRLVYKEKVNRRQAIGIIISLLGIVLASYFTAIS
jgi:drug/metabolite transporter (DMT)-like permease